MGETALAAAAAAGDEEAFRRLVEPIRRDLHLLCYRLLGSFHDAEDVVQEAQVKAWRRLATFDGRASFRTWMFRVATNACLDALRTRRRRALPQDVGGVRDPAAGFGERREDIPWLEPYPDALLPDADPEAATELRESVRLAFVHALQFLPPRQRAVLILRDVLDWSAREVAAALGTSVAAVNSSLQRARETLARHTPPRHGSSADARDRHRAELAARYVRAWEAGDIDGIVAMLTADAVQAMPPWSAWFVGRETLRRLYASYRSWGGRPGAGVFRMVPTALNGELGFAEYCRDQSDGVYRPLALTLVVPDASGTLIAEKVSFVSPELFPVLGFPASPDR
jgi:RNA polymerase sigma-70 factor (ECF subfamily)